MDTGLGALDRLVLVAEDDSAVEFGGLVAVPEPAAAQAPTGRARLTAAAGSTHIAVIGWSGFGANVLKELDEFLPTGSPVDVVLAADLVAAEPIAGITLENTSARQGRGEGKEW